jgi:hypothetical protein
MDAPPDFQSLQIIAPNSFFDFRHNTMESQALLRLT